MKKLMIALCAATMITAAKAEWSWSWWVGDDKADADQRGCAIGIATERKSVSGAQLGLLWNRSKKLNAGYQGACGYCRADKIANGCQNAFVCSADSAALQIGLLCFNKTGFLPFFVFFNFDPKMFGGGK